jgi:predicted secreted hydrolase
MQPWNAIPLNTIGIVIGLSLLMLSILAILLIKIKRYEELGWTIGVFLIILSSVTYFYIIPHEIVNNAVIPDNYIWEDEGNVYYWERNSVFLPGESKAWIPIRIRDSLSKRDPIIETFTGREVIHVTDFNRYENKATIHDAIYDENGEVLSVINGMEQVSEWYEIDTHLTSLKYVNVEGGRMGIPSDTNGLNTMRVGWVESSGKKDGQENVVLVRDMKRVKTGFIDGLELHVWQSDISNKEIVWHGDSYICDETLRLTVDPSTGYVVHVYRHLVLSAHLSQFVELYYPDTLKSRFMTRFLKSTDPVGEAAELIYETTNESQARHIAEAKSLNGQLTYYPILICVPLFIIGLALVWRYCGRSYYWKRYKEFEVQKVVLKDKEATKHSDISLPLVFNRRRSRKKIIGFLVGIIIIFSSIGYVAFGPRNENGDLLFFFSSGPNHLDIPTEPPTPPGTSRAIDSGRHVLEPADEGAHKLAKREWWYFNVFFDNPTSDLNGWSMIISFNKMAPRDLRFLKTDNLFIVLYDDKGTSYEFSVLNQRRGTLKAATPGVDVTFKESWAKGEYPSWQIHAENSADGFVGDFSFSADFMPTWVEGRSSNLVLGKYLAGDYYVPRCEVEGKITWDNKEYVVYGKGYYDHVWEANIPRFVSKGWDWFNLHFDNGWEIYLSRFMLRFPRTGYAGAIMISPGNRNIIEWAKFKMEYVETSRSKSIRSMSYPVKFHIEASRDDMTLELDITSYNVCEIAWKYARIGMFEGPCYATGKFSWSGNTVELNGYGMSEITRVKYLLSGLGILERLRERFSNIFSS